MRSSLGDPGTVQVDFRGASAAMELVLDKLKPHLGDGHCVALVNNLGSTTPLEMSVLTHTLAKAGVVSHVIGPAPMMTSLDMHGFSISVLPVDDQDLAALTQPVPMSAWPGVQALGAVQITALPDGLTPIAPIPSANDKTRATILHVADLLISAEDTLNALDAKSGDGDTGLSLIHI